MYEIYNKCLNLHIRRLRKLANKQWQNARKHNRYYRCLKIEIDKLKQGAFDHGW